MTTIIKSNMTIAEKRDLVDQALSGGHFAKIAWIKKDGSYAERNCKKFMEKLFTSGDKNNVKANPAEHVKALYTCVDAADEAKWVNISLNKLVEIKANKQHYVFE